MKVQRWPQRLAIAALICGFSLTAAGCGAAPWAAGLPPASPSAKPVSVVIATRDIPAGTRITNEMVTIRMFDKSQADYFAFTRIDRYVVGRYAYITIHAGQAVLDFYLVDKQLNACRSV